MANEPNYIYDDEPIGTMGFGNTADTSSITTPPPQPQSWGDLGMDVAKLGAGSVVGQLGAGARYTGYELGSPSIQGFGDYLTQKGEDISGSISPGGKEITEAPIFSSETLQHPFAKTSMGVAKAGLWNVPALISGGEGYGAMAARAAIGGALGISGAYSGVVDSINAQPDDQLQKLSPTYMEIRKTLPEYDAKQVLGNQAWSNLSVWEKAAIVGTSALAGEAGPLTTVGKTVAGTTGRTIAARFADNRFAKAGINAIETGAVQAGQYAGTAIPTREALTSVGVPADTSSDIASSTIEQFGLGAVIGGGTRFIRPHGGKNESRSDTRPTDAWDRSNYMYPRDTVSVVQPGQADPAQAQALKSAARPTSTSVYMDFTPRQAAPPRTEPMQYPEHPFPQAPNVWPGMGEDANRPPPPTPPPGPEPPPIPPRTGPSLNDIDARMRAAGIDMSGPLRTGNIPPEQPTPTRPVPQPPRQGELPLNRPDQPQRQTELPLQPPPPAQRPAPEQGTLDLQRPQQGVTQLGLQGMGANTTLKAAPPAKISAEPKLPEAELQLQLNKYGMPRMLLKKKEAEAAAPETTTETPAPEKPVAPKGAAFKRGKAAAEKAPVTNVSEVKSKTGAPDLSEHPETAKWLGEEEKPAAPTVSGEQPIVARNKFGKPIGTFREVPAEGPRAAAAKEVSTAKEKPADKKATGTFDENKLGKKPEAPAGELAGAPKMPQPSRKQEIAVTHRSSNIDSLKAGWEKRDLGISFARDAVPNEKAYSSPTVGDAEGRKGTVKATVKGKGLDYDIGIHRAYIEKLHKLAEKLPGHRDVAVINHLRANGIDWVSGWNGIGASHELHVLNPDAVKIERIIPDKDLKTVPSKGQVPVRVIPPSSPHLGGMKHSPETLKAAAEHLSPSADTTLPKTPLVKTNTMRTLLEKLGYNHDDFKRMKLADVQRIIQTGERKPTGGTSDILSRIEKLEGHKEEHPIEKAKGDVALNPTDAQEAAGNFKQGHPPASATQGQPVTIHSAEGKVGEAEGHILGTANNIPGKHLEAIIHSSNDTGKIHVINQVDEEGHFKDHLAVTGAKDSGEAIGAYFEKLNREGISIPDLKSKEFTSGVVAMTPEEFERWKQTRNPEEPVYPTATGTHPFDKVEVMTKAGIKEIKTLGSQTVKIALEEALRKLPNTHEFSLYRKLAQQAIKYIPDLPIYDLRQIDLDKIMPSGANAAYSTRRNFILRGSKEALTTSPEVILLHEVMHAATSHMYYNNKTFRGRVDRILTEYQQDPMYKKEGTTYNITIGKGPELLAEIANPFVEGQLARIQMSNALAKELDMDTWAKNTQTLWGAFVKSFKDGLEKLGFIIPGKDDASKFTLLDGMLRLNDEAFMARSKLARTDFAKMNRTMLAHRENLLEHRDNEHNSQQNIYDTIHDAVSNPEKLQGHYDSEAKTISDRASDLVNKLPRGMLKQKAYEYVVPLQGSDSLRMDNEGLFGPKTEANPHRRYNETGLMRDKDFGDRSAKVNNNIADMFDEYHGHTKAEIEHLSDTFSHSTAYRFDPRYKIGEGNNEWMKSPGWQWRNEAKQASANADRITKMYNAIAPGLKPRYTKMLDDYRVAGREHAEQNVKELIDSISNAGQKFLEPLKVIDPKEAKLRDRQEYIKFHNDWETNWDKNKETLRDHLLNNNLTEDEERWLAERGFKDLSDVRDLANPRGPFVPLDHGGDFIINARTKIEPPTNGTLVDGTDNVFKFKTQEEAEAFLNKQPPKSKMSAVYFNDEGKQVPKWEKWQKPDGSVGLAKDNKAYHVEVNDKYYSGHDSISGANRRYDALKASGMFAKISLPQSQRSGWYSGLEISSPLFKHLINEVEKRTDYSPAQKKAVTQLLKDSALSSMEGNRIAKHLLPRKVVAGWETDYIKTYKSYFDAHNALMSRAKYAKDINAAINEMIKYADDHQDDAGATDRSLTLKELNKRDNFFGTPNHLGDEGNGGLAGRVLKYAEAASFFANMVSPGHLITHQTHQILTFDMLAAKYGPAKTMARASKMHGTLAGTGFRNVLRSVGAIRDILTKNSKGLNYVESLMDKVTKDPKYGAELKAMLDQAIATNRIHPDQGFDASVLNMGSGRLDRGLARLDLASRQMMGSTEAYSRVWGYSLGYTLARDAGETPQQAMRTAFDTVSRTQGMLSRSNMSSVMNKWYMRAPMQFRAWGINMMITLAKSIHDVFKPDAPGVRAEAVRRLLYLFGSTAALTGINGLPSDPMRVGLALTGALGLTNYNWSDAQDKMREFFAEETSPAMANFLMDGALASLGPFSFFGADRVGFGSLAVFGEPDDYTKGSLVKWGLQITGGAPFEQLWNVRDGVDGINEGNYAKAIKAFVPLKIVADWAKAWQGAHEGFPTKTGAPGMEPYSTGEAFIQSLGLTPARKERWREATEAEYRAEKATRDEKSQLLNALGSATTEPDRIKARMQIAAFNLRNPQSRLTPQDMMKAARRQTAPAGLGKTLYKGNRERIQSLESYYEAY